MNFSAAKSSLLRPLIAIACLAATFQVSAAPRFIASSFVEGDDQSARISVQLRCNVELVTYQPRAMGDNLRIRLDATQVCTGAAPSIAFNREQHRPIDADTARLLSLEYDGDAPEGQILRFNFSEEVHFEVIEPVGNDTIAVQVRFNEEKRTTAREDNTSTSRLVQNGDGAPPRYVINLESSVRLPATADMPDITLEGETELFVTEAVIDGETWYRTRIGYYASAEQASRALRNLRNRFPSAWIDQVDASGLDMAVDVVPSTETGADESPVIAAAASPEDGKVAALMDEARRAMIGGELSRAIQLYTKVLQLPPNPYQQDAQEYLALARERNGQIAHAKAEYQRYLSVYPDGDGVDRVEQRLAALVATASPDQRSAATGSRAAQQARSQSPWTVRTFASQFYRRDVNQVNDQEEITSQSSIYTDVSLDARRRGERFDFSARFTGGHRYDLLDEEDRQSTRNDRDVRMSYAYVDLADSDTRLRGRLGRQTRNSGGVLGRFDGLNLTYGLTQRLELEAVVGRPVFSTADSVDDSRTFYGLSGKYGPIGENLDVRVFALQQDIEGLTDRQSVGGEVRYFGDTTSIWGMLDYDLEFSELGSLFVQGSVRLPSNYTVTGLIDRRQSPYLSLSNAMIGQPVEDFAALTNMYTAEEIYQLALDRSAATTTFTLGLSKPLTPKLQLGINGTQSTIEATQESGGVPGNPKSTYSYLSLDLVASSLFSERDVTIFGVRYAESTTSNIYTFNIDSRFSIGRSWRISPRLRVDYREIASDASEQWTYTPSLRLEYRWGRKVRFELTAGQQYSARESDSLDQDRESYYISAGYQLFF
jgi:tetratricopeptide (TPR) repeat protein